MHDLRFTSRSRARTSSPWKEIGDPRRDGPALRAWPCTGMDDGPSPLLDLADAMRPCRTGSDTRHGREATDGQA